MAGGAPIAERRRLVINADDFGFTEGVNRGIIEAFEAGALRSASVMAGMPGFEDAARAARVAGRALGTGVHLTLTNGRPLSHCPSLVDRDSGDFVSLRRLALRALTARVRSADVANECAAQIARCRAAGLRVTHLDSHQHVHTLPNVREAVREVVRRERIPFWRWPAEALWHPPRRAGRLPERVVIALLARSSRTQPNAQEPRRTDHFAGTALLGSPDPEQLLLQILDALPGGTTELMVHPGYVNGPLPGGDTYIAGRERELRALTSAAVLGRLRRGDIELTHFGTL